jgi:hypothetical protein
LKRGGKMKKILSAIGILLVVFACSTQKKSITVNQSEQNATEQDSVEYGIETFDAKFETWYQLQNNPSQYRSQSYYESWNKQYVSAWNNKALTSRNRFFEPIVGYNPSEDYGFELNHELFYYFQYVENVLKIKIMPQGPKAVQF